MLLKTKRPAAAVQRRPDTVKACGVQGESPETLRACWSNSQLKIHRGVGCQPALELVLQAVALGFGLVYASLNQTRLGQARQKRANRREAGGYAM